MERIEAAAYWEDNAETWARCVRAGYDVYRDSLNTPFFLTMLPVIHGLSGLDIGCGEGANTRHLARLGATMQAIDIAPTFIRHAEAAERSEPLGITYRIGDGMDLPFEDGTFDFATAFMSLMDMPDSGRALKEAARVLRFGGFLQFSILHPCFVPPHRKVLRDEENKPYAIEIGGYFDNIDGRMDMWSFSAMPDKERAQVEPFRTPRFHRTLSQWVEMICDAGLSIEQTVELCATSDLAHAEPVVADARIVPHSLLFRVRKRDSA